MKSTHQYQAYSEFTAHGHTVMALMSMYGLIQEGAWQHRPLTPVIVFMAFSIESYLNSIGERKVAFWGEVERLSWKKKVNILHSVAGRTPDWAAEPLQFATAVFSIRDRLAHGRSERVVGDLATDRNDALKQTHTHNLLPGWLQPIDINWVMKAKGRFRELMVYLGNLYGFHESDHLLSGTGGILTHDA